ncbi:virulence factor TspB C-terminal domain-related protein [Acinetobacter sp. ANC 5045]|uniref:virulence factor TspB C-terminal domain-related protein n=1 Tax=Acinetobacter sp. ANC 5045 TaxID=2529851 RepID=UPI00103F4C71|nr:virulence factor TspB C-terminal domain-related protein [Acinetobacter sp. ANC 5045]TCB14922.1 hypothetical protein E0H79_12005 [Acinetobacter sp. ANC 5045]
MKTIIKIFICLSLIYTPFFAFAGAAEKWEVLENNYDHVSNKVKIEARKITQDAANSGRYKVEVPVNPSALGKTVKTMMWTGIAVAGVQAMLEGIGWVIDHGSQTIKRPTGTTNPNQIIDGVYVCISNGCANYNVSQSGYFSALSAALNNFNSVHRPNNPITKSEDLSLIYSAYNELLNRAVNNPNTRQAKNVDIPGIGIDPQISVWAIAKVTLPEPEFEYLSDSGLGNEIIGKGENTQPLPSAVQDAYSPNNPAQSEPAPQATQDALDNANPQPEQEPKGESETEPEIDPETGEATGKEKTTFELPNFCSWAPAVCDFFKVQKADNKDIKNNQREQIQQDKTFFEKVSDWFDWSQADDDLPDNESPEIVEHVMPDLKEDAISWGAACPADVSIPISMQGVSSTLVFSWGPWCQLLSIIKPAIIASAYIGAAFIVLGLRT